MSVIRLSADQSSSNDKTTRQQRQTFFISDLHLDPIRPDTIELSLRFFAHVKSAQALFIMGDLFEYWLGDDAADPRLSCVYDAISELSANGTAVHLMHGNRDFLLGEQFAKRIGAHLHTTDHIEVDFGTARFSLLHGDTLCTDDTQYQQLRGMLRNPQWQQEFLSLSIEDRIEKAQELREQSREAVSTKLANTMDVNDDAVNAHCNQFPNDCLIHGHTHQPFDHALVTDTGLTNTRSTDTSSTNFAGTPRRLVLGDWKSDHAMIARYDGEQLLFERYS